MNVMKHTCCSMQVGYMISGKEPSLDQLRLESFAKNVCGGGGRPRSVSVGEFSPGNATS